MALTLTGEIGGIEIVSADTLDDEDSLRGQNPLGKIPALILPCGAVLFDSRTILEYLAHLHPQAEFFPEAPLERALEQTRVTLADGITDSALLLIYENRFRDAGQSSSRWIAHQTGRIDRALSAIALELPALGGPLSASALGLVSALGYLDWRRPVEWRDAHRELAAWLAAFDAAFPALAQTRPD